jgi:hypothetical protein
MMAWSKKVWNRFQVIFILSYFSLRTNIFGFIAPACVQHVLTLLEEINFIEMRRFRTTAGHRKLPVNRSFPLYNYFKEI